MIDGHRNSVPRWIKNIITFASCTYLLWASIKMKYAPTCPLSLSVSLSTHSHTHSLSLSLSPLPQLNSIHPPLGKSSRRTSCCAFCGWHWGLQTLHRAASRCLQAAQTRAEGAPGDRRLISCRVWHRDGHWTKPNSRALTHTKVANPLAGRPCCAHRRQCFACSCLHA